MSYLITHDQPYIKYKEKLLVEDVERNNAMENLGSNTQPSNTHHWQHIKKEFYRNAQRIPQLLEMVNTDCQNQIM